MSMEFQYHRDKETKRGLGPTLQTPATREGGLPQPVSAF